MLHLVNIAKRFGEKLLFHGIDLHVAQGDRIGLVGGNGTGKTTLFRLLTGEAEPDDGEIAPRKLLHIGYLPQELEIRRSGALLRTVVDGVRNMGALRAERAEVLDALRNPPEDPEAADALAHRLAEIEDRFSHLGGYELEGQTREVLAGLGFVETDFDRPLNTFSGGWQVRAELARLLLERPDLLLLDEPTNHLDLESMQWFERFLGEFAGAFIIVSHDREFLNRTVNRIVEATPTGMRSFPGDYDRYRRAVAEDRTLQAKRYKDQQARIREIQDFIDRNRARKDRARQVQSRAKMLEQMERVAPPEAEDASIHFRFPQPPRTGDNVLRLEGITKRYGDHVVLEDVDLLVRRGERVAVVGHNGAGKSTLLKIVAGRLAAEGGARILGSNVTFDYFAQHQLEALNVSNTVLREMETVADMATAPTVRGLLGAFRFSGDEVEKRVAVLSGGEKARLALAKMLIHPANLLLLDEPTNHLDIASREVLERALQTFEGTLIFTSHDRRFIDALATSVLEVADRGVTSYPGNYSDYMRKLAKSDAEADRADSARPRTSERPSDRERERKRREAEERERRARSLKPLAKEAEKLERTIHAGEEKLAGLAKSLTDPSVYEDAERARRLAAEHDSVQRRLETLMERWEKVHEDLEAARAALDDDLA